MTNKPDGDTVHVLVYTHRHGVDVTSYATEQLADDAVIEIVRENLHEVPELERSAISGALESGDAAQIATAIEMYMMLSEEHMEITATTVQRPEPSRPPLKPMCPKCTTTDPTFFEIMEHYAAYHPVTGLDERGCLNVENALSTPSPSVHFDDGANDYKAHCKCCQHDGPVQSFGLGEPSEWEWV